MGWREQEGERGGGGGEREGGGEGGRGGGRESPGDFFNLTPTCLQNVYKNPAKFWPPDFAIAVNLGKAYTV